jgi:AraC-like DNA-binding protein
MSLQNEYHYLPVDDRTAEWGFYLTAAGRVMQTVAMSTPHGLHPEMYMFDQSPAPDDQPITASSREKGRVLPEFAVVYVTETHGVFESDETGVVEFDGPTLLFLFPGVWHRYRPIGTAKNWLTSRWLAFNGDLGYRLLRPGYVTPGTAVRQVVRSQDLTVAFDRMIDRVAATAAADPILLSMRAMDLLVDCIEFARGGQDVQNASTPEASGECGEALVARMTDLIWTGSHRDLTIDQLCEAVGTKRRSMERWFRKARGRSLLSEVNLCRSRRAQHFLETTDLPLKNICWLAGFRNTEQMRLTFLQLVGMPPDHYRQSHRRAVTAG